YVSLLKSLPSGKPAADFVKGTQDLFFSLNPTLTELQSAVHAAEWWVGEALAMRGHKLAQTAGEYNSLLDSIEGKGKKKFLAETFDHYVSLKPSFTEALALTEHNINHVTMPVRVATLPLAATPAEYIAL